MITATLTTDDGEVCHTWQGRTMYDIIIELRSFLATGGVSVAPPVDSRVSDLKAWCLEELDGAILGLISDTTELTDSGILAGG